MTGRGRTGLYAIGALVLVAVIWLGVSWRHATRAPVAPQPASKPAPAATTARPPQAEGTPSASPPAPPPTRPPRAAAPGDVAAKASRPKVDWDATPVLDGQDTDLPPALRQGIGDAASAYFHGAGRHHLPRLNCWKRYPPPANAPEPIRLELDLWMKREDGRLIIAGVALDHANFDLGELGDCLDRGWAAFDPVPIDAPGVKAGPPFRTELHVQQYARRPEDNEGDAPPAPTGPMVAMAIGGRGKTPDCPSTLRTSAAAGAPCKTPMDCAEVCCGCPANDRWFATSVCDQGRCVGGAAACKVALAFPAKQLCAASAPSSGGH